jgi:RNA polymerase sigma-70 factor (ECF subfamily)
MNHAIDLHRRKKPRHTLSIHSEESVELTSAKLETQPVNQLEREEDRHLIQQALALLSPEHRSVLVMKEIDDLRYEEIAEVLEVPVGTVRSRLHRARMEMKDILEKLQDSGQ